MQQPLLGASGALLRFLYFLFCHCGTVQWSCRASVSFTVPTLLCSPRGTWREQSPVFSGKIGVSKSSGSISRDEGFIPFRSRCCGPTAAVRRCRSAPLRFHLAKYTCSSRAASFPCCPTSSKRATLYLQQSAFSPFQSRQKKKRIKKKNQQKQLGGKCLLCSSAHSRSSCAGVCLLSLHPSLRRAPSEGCKIGENCCVMLH